MTHLKHTTTYVKLAAIYCSPAAGRPHGEVCVRLSSSDGLCGGHRASLPWPDQGKLAKQMDNSQKQILNNGKMLAFLAYTKEEQDQKDIFDYGRVIIWKHVTQAPQMLHNHRLEGLPLLQCPQLRETQNMFRQLLRTHSLQFLKPEV